MHNEDTGIWSQRWGSLDSPCTMALGTLEVKDGFCLQKPPQKLRNAAVGGFYYNVTPSIGTVPRSCALFGELDGRRRGLIIRRRRQRIQRDGNFVVRVLAVAGKDVNTGIRSLGALPFGSRCESTTCIDSRTCKQSERATSEGINSPR